MARKTLFSKSRGVTLRDELEMIGAQIAHLGERTVGEGQEKLNEELIRLKETFEDLVERAEDKTYESIDNVTHKIQERPMEAILASFAAGAVLAALIVRR